MFEKDHDGTKQIVQPPSENSLFRTRSGDQSEGRLLGEAFPVDGQPLC